MSFCGAVSGILLLLSGSAVQGSGPVICSQTRICAVTGSAVTISCRFSPPIRGRDAVLETPWFLNGRPVGQRSEPDSAGRVQALCGPTACTLRLTDLRESDSGRYRFWFRTNRGSHSGSPGVNLTVTALQVKVLKSELRRSFTRADLKCVSSCQADHQSYIWTRNRRDVLNQTSASVSVSVRPADTYSCSLEGNQEFPSPSVYPPLPPSVSVSPSAEVQEGSSVTLTCSSDANPAASYSWYKEDQPLPNGGGARLHFISISSEDKGIYYCKAENRFGRKISKPLSLNVHYPPLPPSVSVSPSAEVQEGSSVTLTCSSDANPAASYSWYKEDEESPRASGQNFTITDVRPEHSGNYSCRAENTRGRRSSTVHLEVKGSRSAAAAGSAAVLLPVIFLSVCLWIRRKKRSSKETAELRADDLQQEDPEQQDELHYVRVSFIRKQPDGAAQSPRGNQRSRHGDTRDDPAALYSSVNKHRN